MNREDPYRDQAERLRKRIVLQKESEELDEIQSLPSRAETHKQKQRHKKTKVKVKYPLIRVLAVFFILLPITALSVYTYLEGKNNEKAQMVNFISDEFEAIDFDNKAIDIEEEQNVPIKDDDKKEEQDVIINPSSKEIGKDDKNSPPSEEIKKKQTKSNQITQENQTTPKERIIYHTVQQKETLFSIAMKYYQSQTGIAVIKSLNGIQGEEIQAGQVLKIKIKEQ